MQPNLRVILLLALAACGPADEPGTEPAAEPVAGPPSESRPEPAADPEGGIDSPPWQDAIARGVDFRAHGQEPGWTLDIDREGRVVYIGDYGADTLSASAPEPARTGVAETWTVSANGRELSARIREQDCSDAMSGERFTHVVELDVDGRSLTGCGRRLDR